MSSGDAHCDGVDVVEVAVAGGATGTGVTFGVASGVFSET